MENRKYSRTQLEKLIETIVGEEGIRPEYKGCRYINEAVYMILQDEERLNALTKEVYAEIANSHGTSIPSVERTIRFAINKVATNTNKAFIATITQKVRKNIS